MFDGKFCQVWYGKVVLLLIYYVKFRLINNILLFIKGVEIICFVLNYYFKFGCVNKVNDIYKGEIFFLWFFSRLCCYGV